MLQKLSYFNLTLAIIYLLAYLKSGTFSSTAGIFVVIVFSWLFLKSYQLDDYQWKFWHYGLGLWMLYFIGTILYGAISVLGASIEYDFISDDTLLYIIFSFIFCFTVIIHFILYFFRNYAELKK